MISADEGYRLYRGKCKQMSEEACKTDPSLTLVRGHYLCPIWGVEEPHWWCERQDGSILDPTKDQFPSKGMGVYTPFSGRISCAECGESVLEADAYIYGRYAYCSGQCCGRHIGVC
jgi:hypothetical protein